MRAFIYTGGTVRTESITEHPKADDLCIAADSGYHTAKALGERIDLLLGDFDSIGSVPRDEGVEIQQVPAEKDYTDTQLAVEIAIERGADEIIIVGGLSGRLDHTLSTLAILEDLHTRGLHGYITDGQSRAHYIKSSSTLVARSTYKYLSLIAADEVVKGVDIEGCKYPLKRATIRRRNQFAVSNEITGNVAFIAVKKGGVFIIESRDA
ncbi:MAG: thiamine diphosphokinase [Clostridia bacterium]|nr:thiamine diphosphokinase [Clostridia bacterium]